MQSQSPARPARRAAARLAESLAALDREAEARRALWGVVDPADGEWFSFAEWRERRDSRRGE